MKVGEYELELPDFWQQVGEVHSKPQFHRWNVAAMPGVSFDLFVFEGCGADAAARARIIGGHIDGLKAARHLEQRENFQGVPLEWHRLEECAALGPAAVYELHACEAYGDLLIMGSGFAATVETQESLQLLFRTMLMGAIVRRGRALHAAPRKRGWLDFFRR